jgi:methionyl-tRNA formyltransferase
MRIAFFGSSIFSVPSLKAVASNVVTVITKKARPKGRGYHLDDSEIKKTALELELPVKEIDTFKDDEAQELRGIEVDLFVVASFGLIIPRWLLDIPSVGAINVHPSLLPQYRGPSPIQWALLDGAKETGITIIKMTEKMDAGPIVYQESMAIDDRENTLSLSERLSKRAGEILPNMVTEIGRTGSIDGREQEERLATYCPIIDKRMGLIEWHQTAVEILQRVRAFVEWPTAYTFLAGKMLKVFDGLEVAAADRDDPGTVYALSKDGFMVATGKGTVLLTDVQIENKKRVTGRDFANGYRNLTGKVLGR